MKNNPRIQELISLINIIKTLSGKGDLLEQLVDNNILEELNVNLEYVLKEAFQEIGQIEYDKLSDKSNLI